MAITDLQISDTLETDAPSIRYSGTEGPRSPEQQQQEMRLAQQIWEALGPEQQSQFQSFEQFFRSGVWKQILQQMQQDEGPGPGPGPGPEQEGIGSLGPRNMEQQMPMPNRMGAEYGGRIGYRHGSPHSNDPERMKKVKFLVEVMGMSPEQALQRVTSQSEGSFPRQQISPPQAPLRPRPGPPGMGPPPGGHRGMPGGIESLRGRR